MESASALQMPYKQTRKGQLLLVLFTGKWGTIRLNRYAWETSKLVVQQEYFYTNLKYGCLAMSK
jgi:hypothetical protein